MRNLILILSVTLGLYTVVSAQTKVSPYKFTDAKSVANTSVKNQHRSGTCWSFSALSFIESELLRTQKKTYDLSEMFIVYTNYIGKAERYVRFHGNCHFAGGGAVSDIFWTLDHYGLMPESVYQGLNYGEDKHNHSDLDKVLLGFMKSIVDTKTLSPFWKTAYTNLLQTYLGTPKETFEFEGKEYTPKSFAQELGIQSKDYVRIVSVQHLPLYQASPIEVPDNWTNSTAYNVSLDEFYSTAVDAIDKGYSFAWGGDVSEKGFSWKNGVAIIAEDDVKKMNLEGTDRDRFEKLATKAQVDSLYAFEKMVTEKKITPELRQKAYDDYSTTDDHGMHAVGYAKDQKGTLYFKIKNSWDIDNPHKGYIYMSEAFFKYKTLDILLHKDALSKEMKLKLGLN